MNKFKALLKSFLHGLFTIFHLLFTIIILIYQLPILLLNYIILLITGKYKDSEFRFKLHSIKFILKNINSDIVIFTSRKVQARTYLDEYNEQYIEKYIEYEKEEKLG